MGLRLSVILICLLLYGAVSAIAANTGKIAGTATDKVSGQPLPGALIVVEGTKLGAVADASGDYFILNVPPGVYAVRGSLLGFARLTQTDVRVRMDQTTALNFALTEEAIQAEGITIVAEKPKVELDLTASKESMSREEIGKSWGTNVKDIVSDIPAANINGGIRGSFGLDVAYRLDGIDLRDPGSNTNFASVNLSTIQEVEVLTGGFNAEYGQANGSIVNIVTRKAEDRIHTILSYRMRPKGKYHWGRSIYDKNDIFHTVMATPEFWDPTKKWQSEWMTSALPGYSGGSDYWARKTPEERAAFWQSFVNDETRFPQFDYADRMQWEQEATVYGPLLPDVTFMISGRYQEGVGVYPSALKYNPDMTYQGVVDWNISPETKLNLSGMFTKFTNSGAPRTTYQSSETSAGGASGPTEQQLPYIIDPYNEFKYWMYGNVGGTDAFTIRPPEKTQMLNLQAKLTQIVDTKTFFEVAAQASSMRYRLDYGDIARSANYRSYGLPLPTDTLTSLYGFDSIPSLGRPPISFWGNSGRWGYPGDIWLNWADTRSYTFKGDLTSQVMKHHLIKAGVVFSLQQMEKKSHEGGLFGASKYAQVNDIVPIKDKPYEGGAYVQDKIELGGMVLNAGLRLDFFNANKNVSADIYDPLMISAQTVGNSGMIGRVGYNQYGTGPGYVKTPTRFALSPRIGISHPITETTVLHFMFGRFNQRPAWSKILSNPVVWTNQLPAGMNSDWNLPDTTLVTYRYFGQKTGNPALTWEKMIQYEIGFEQNIANKFSLDVTMYYKDAYDLTSLGVDQGPASTNISESGGNVDVRLYGEPNPQNIDNRVPGLYIGNFTTTVNGAWADVRGLETKLSSKFNWVNFDLSYTFSYLATGSYHLSKMYKTFYDTTTQKYYTNGVPTYQGASNSDGGGVGTDDARWNPHNSALLKLTVVSPEEFGPSLGGFYPLADWSITTSTRWVQGEVYTYYSPDYTGIQTPDNRTWDDRWSTNLNLNRTLRITRDITMRLFVQVTNLFNQKHLKLLSNSTSDPALTTYMEEGTLPFNLTTREPAEWSWYTNLPRQVNLGTSIEF
jgi:outer membrane receptor protein involved in Fe transport